MFEERLQQVITEAKARPQLILFVDEAHMIGAGSALGAPSDAANILKSVLARGEVRMIAATTLSEYKEHLQEDEALARRRGGRARTVAALHAASPPPRQSHRLARHSGSACRERVVGQSKAISAVARRLVLNKGPLKDGFDRPDGVLLFLGPTGASKTELAKAVTEFLFGDDKEMIRIDMRCGVDDDARAEQPAACGHVA